MIRNIRTTIRQTGSDRPESHRALAMLVLTTITVVVLATHAAAQTYTVLYSFKGGADGAGPVGSLVGDTAGNLYGTTDGGGNPACRRGDGCGTVFKLDSSGNETVLHRFKGSDGSQPAAGLIRDGAGNLYGTTSYGGSRGSLGTVFKVSRTGVMKVLHNFVPGEIGVPQSRLLRDAVGNLYGTTLSAVFKLDPSGILTVLLSDNGQPNALIRDKVGNLYGVMGEYGRLGGGSVFKLDSTGIETVLYDFTFGGPDGSNPTGPLVGDGKGTLYGATRWGGDGSACASGCGTVFKVNTAGNETVLWRFTNGSDGEQPTGVVRDSAGNLYGVAEHSGTHYGVVFKLDPSGNLTVLHSFAGGTDGEIAQFNGGLLLDAAGNLYGTAQGGGDLSGCYGRGCGLVFKITPQ